MILGLDPIYIILLVMIGVMGVIGFMTYRMNLMLVELRGMKNELRKLRKIIQSNSAELYAHRVRATSDVSPIYGDRDTSGNLNHMHDSRTDITAKLPRVSIDMAATSPMPRR